MRYDDRQKNEACFHKPNQRRPWWKLLLNSLRVRVKWQAKKCPVKSVEITGGFDF